MKVDLKSVWVRLGRLGRWLWQAHMAIEATALMIIPLALFRCFDKLGWGTTLNLTAGLLQIGGMILVLLGIEATAETFEKPKLTARIKKWWKDRPPWIQHHRLRAEQGTYLSVGSSIDMSVAAQMEVSNPPPSLEQRLILLETSHKALRDDHVKLHERFGAFRKYVVTQLEDQGQEHHELRTTVTHHLAGDLGELYMGWALVAAGTLYAAVAVVVDAFN